MESTYLMLDCLQKLLHLPLRFYDRTGRLCLFRQKTETAQDPFETDPALKNKFIFVNAPQPAFLQEQDKIVYAFFQDATGNTLILGPAAVKPLTEEDLALYRKAHALPAEAPVPYAPLETILTAVTTLYFVITKNYIAENELLPEAEAPGAVEEQQEQASRMEWVTQEQQDKENETERMPFREELATFEPITKGDVASVKERFRRINLAEQVPKMAKDQYKHYEYMLCVSITPAARAAIAGGLDPNESYHMADVYLHSLEKCSTLGELMLLQKDVMLGFTRRVHQIKTESETQQLVIKCKEFIETHLHKKFTLEELADELFVSKCYLSRVFSQSEGMGIFRYATKRRIETAKRSLRFSDTPIADIASYLCFSSQSHFSKVFRELTGYTPLQYRNYQKESAYLHNFLAEDANAQDT